MPWRGLLFSPSVQQESSSRALPVGLELVILQHNDVNGVCPPTGQCLGCLRGRKTAWPQCQIFLSFSIWGQSSLYMWHLTSLDAAEGTRESDRQEWGSEQGHLPARQLGSEFSCVFFLQNSLPLHASVSFSIKWRWEYLVPLLMVILTTYRAVDRG